MREWEHNKGIADDWGNKCQLMQDFYVCCHVMEVQLLDQDLYTVVYTVVN